MQLYPLKFAPLYFDKIWGGNKLKDLFKRTEIKSDKCGESWEISGVENHESIVVNGFLAGNTLNELIEIYMDELLGSHVYELFGNQFPLLFKFIDANDYLSVQVHPNDDLAFDRHKSYGKTEMWYIINAEKNASIINGFNRTITKEDYLALLSQKKITDVLNIVPVRANDSIFIPAGRVHAIGPGNFLAEIQQTSDITYRIYDWDRTDTEGKPRELHTEQALDAIDFLATTETKIKYKTEPNKTSNITNCPYFSCNVLQFNQTVEKVYVGIDSFVVYMVVEGACALHCNEQSEILNVGDTILIPASIEEITLEPITSSKVLEIYIP